MRIVAIIAFAALALSACQSDSGAQKNASKSREVMDDGLPAWIDDACSGQPKGAICAVGESNFAKVDVEAAKTDAETAAKNRIADQLQAKVGRLTERLNQVMAESSGEPQGLKTLKDVNQNFVDQELIGLRYTEYFYYPDRVSPEKIWVRAVLTPDDAKISQEVIAAMNQAAAAEQLEMDHQEAQLRFEQVRQQYLAEEN